MFFSCSGDPVVFDITSMTIFADIRVAFVIATMHCTEPGRQGQRQDLEFSIDHRLTEDRPPVDHHARASFGTGIGLTLPVYSVASLSSIVPRCSQRNGGDGARPQCSLCDATKQSAPVTVVAMFGNDKQLVDFADVTPSSLDQNAISSAYPDTSPRTSRTRARPRYGLRRRVTRVAWIFSGRIGDGPGSSTYSCRHISAMVPSSAACASRQVLWDKLAGIVEASIASPPSAFLPIRIKSFPERTAIGLDS